MNLRNFNVSPIDQTTTMLGRLSQSAHENAVGNNVNQNSPSNDNPAFMGNASDYILIAMIIAMMLCMAVCCLCLFCRSSSRITFCGFNFEVNDRSASVAVDDLSELHEVVPLTPTVAGHCQIPDIENMLQSDPPPPKYSDVATSTVFDRFKWKSKRRGHSTTDDKSGTDTTISRKSGDGNGRGKSKKADRRRGRLTQRSASYQHPKLSSLRQNTSVSTMPVAEGKSTRKSSRFFTLNARPVLQHSSSDCTFYASTANKSTAFEIGLPEIQDSETDSKADTLNINVPATISGVSGNIQDPCKASDKSEDPPSNEPSAYDDEVFM
ncbi:uncharacterized protein LOC143465091 [Clavelina lepadiformis]|uniref:Uncharacterized protein n=1 Tax=Clavelina lepadiformis TaxID=159417 RepID=A0ABP0EZG8_CLALP